MGVWSRHVRTRSHANRIWARYRRCSRCDGCGLWLSFIGGLLFSVELLFSAADFSFRPFSDFCVMLIVCLTKELFIGHILM
jgi:hypothetical protein